MACFLLALKFSDGCPPQVEDLCRALLGQGVAANPRAVEALELAVLAALQWKVDTVTVTQLLLQSVLLLPAGLRETWTAAMRPHVDAYHVKGLTTDQKASTAAAAITGIVAHTAGISGECMAPWLPAALTPPLDALLRAGASGAGVQQGNSWSGGCGQAVTHPMSPLTSLAAARLQGGEGLSARDRTTLACMEDIFLGGTLRECTFKGNSLLANRGK